MNIKYRELFDKNTSGIPVIYIDRKSDNNDIFEEDRILWDPTEKGLTLAEASPLLIESQKVVLVDSDTKLLGFYFLQEAQGEHRVLAPFYTPTFGDFSPPAPKRPRSKGYGAKLDQEKFEFYLKNLKEFLS